MFKKILAVVILVGVTGTLIFGAINHTSAFNGQMQFPARGNNNTFEASSLGNRWANTSTGVAVEDHETTLASLPPGDLSEAEANALLYMREEEKLAHDVYTYLYAQWGLPIFNNIASSEQMHTEAMQSLLDRYGLDDPATAAEGSFTNPDLQALYGQLISQGSQSPAEALKVGGAIEEIDILDLQSRLAQVDQEDLRIVFENLLKGSYNHLNAFAANFARQTGLAYQPQFLSADAYEAIVNGNGTGLENGARQGRGRGGRQVSAGLIG